MNRERRKNLKKAVSLVNDAVNIIGEVKDEEEEALGNMPESLMYSDQAVQMDENIGTLNECVDQLEQVLCLLEDMGL